MSNEVAIPIWQEFGRLLLSQGWLTNTVTGIGLALLFLPAVDVFDSIRARAVGLGVGATILVWAGVWVYCQAAEAAKVRELSVGQATTVPLSPQSAEPNRQWTMVKRDAEIRAKEGRANDSAKKASQGDDATKVDRSVRIGDGNQFNNSQIITGDNTHVAINMERTISVEQAARITAAAKEFAGGEIQFTFYSSAEDGEALGKQVGEALLRGGNGWVVFGSSISRAMATPFDSVKGFAILVKDSENPPKQAGNFQKVLERGGLSAPARVDPTLPSDRVVFWIGRR